MSADIIQFPKASTRATPDLSKVKLSADEAKRAYVDEVSQAIIADVILKIAMSGISVADERLSKDVLMISESIKSMMLKSLCVDHALQPIVEKMVRVSDEAIAALRMPDPE